LTAAAFVARSAVRACCASGGIAAVTACPTGVEPNSATTSAVADRASGSRALIAA
jgi:hypothetical protein